LKILVDILRKSFRHNKYILIILIVQVLLLQSCSSFFEVFTDIRDEINSTESEITAAENMSDKGALSGGTLNLYLSGISTFNPVYADDVYLQDLYSLLFESLFMLDEDTNAVPVLAKSWEVSENGLEWTITIRSDVYWHDGVKFTANDVNFTLEQILRSAEDNIFKEKLSVIDSFSTSTTDPYILKIVLMRPFSFLPELLTFPVIPMHIYGNGEQQPEMLMVTPIGTGLYKCSETDIKNGMQLSRNTDWWQAKVSVDLEQIPNIEHISARIYDILALEALSEGLVDVAYIDKYYLSEYAENKDTILYTYIGRYFEFISFNTKNKILADREVREVVASIINRDSIVEKLTGNKSAVWELPVLYNTWLLPDDHGIYYNGKYGAKELLGNAGWVLKKELWTKSINGKSEILKLELLVNNDNKLRLDIAGEIKENLKVEGITVNVTALGLEELMKRLNEGKYDMALMGCSIPETSVAAGLYINDQTSSKNPYALRNISQINNDVMAENFRMLYSTTDTADRIDIAADILDRMYNEIAYTGICINSQAVVYSRRIRNIESPYLWNRLNGINDWYVVE